MEREILDHYEAGIEAPRLASHAGILERARTTGDSAHWDLLMGLLRRIESETSLLAVSAHLMMIARR